MASQWGWENRREAVKSLKKSKTCRTGVVPRTYEKKKMRGTNTQNGGRRKEDGPPISSKKKTEAVVAKLRKRGLTKRAGKPPETKGGISGEKNTGKLHGKGARLVALEGTAACAPFCGKEKSPKNALEKKGYPTSLQKGGQRNKLGRNTWRTGRTPPGKEKRKSPMWRGSKLS